jgi:hypothetical protein
LKGAYDFELTWTPTWTPATELAKPGASGISILDAVDKQLRLKLYPTTTPKAALIIDSAIDQPTANAADLATKLAPPAPPSFDVALIKPAKPDEPTDFDISGAQVKMQHLTLKFLMSYAWDLQPFDNTILGPKWLDSDTFDVLAKASTDTMVVNAGNNLSLDPEDLRDMLRSLLTERFQIKAHMEDRPLEGYTLIAVSPKLTRADPLSRTHCLEGPGPDGKDPRAANPMLNRLSTART